MSELPPPPRPDSFDDPGLPPRDRPPPPATWHFVEAFPVLVISLVLTVAVGTPAALVITGCGARFVLEALIGELAFLGAVLIWVRYVNRGPVAALGLPRRPLADLGAGALGGLGLTVLGWIAAIVVFAVARAFLGHDPVQPEQIESCVRGPALVLSGVVVVVAAPLGEETFFRGFLFKGLRRRLGVWPSALISALIFALVHVQPILIFALFPVGVGLAFIYERRQSLLASMAAHAVFNLIGILTIAWSR